MRWMSMIWVRALPLVLAAALFTGNAAAAEDRAGEGDAAQVPTVTIINGTPERDRPPSLPELEVSPGTPARASSRAAPAAPVTERAPRAPSDTSAGARSAAAEAPRDAARTETEPASSGTSGAAGEKKAAASVPRPSPTLSVDIDLGRQVMTVSEDGAALHTWRISTGRYGYHTPTGTYRPTWMSKMWYSRQYDMSPMPHAIFFHKGVAIHGTYDTRSLGWPASHGCVRLTPKNAATLYKLVAEHGKDRTEIVVHGKPTDRIPDAQVASDTPRSGERTERLRRGAPAYRYLPPSYYGRAPAYPPRGFYEGPPRTHRYSAAARRPPRGLYSGYSYGYGF